MRDYCVYCGKKIGKRSREHIIQNALGGVYESEDICCPECNNVVSAKIDAPFTKTFNGIINKIPNMVKTNDKKTKPPCTGKALYNGQIYDVIIKSGKVIACAELSRELKTDVKKLKFDIVSYDFPIDNISFRNGIAKIAFNFAIDQGVDPKWLMQNVIIRKENSVIVDIQFNNILVPFVPLNPVDEFLELEIDTELFHSMILFSQGKNLWCYVDLFNAFQYYVLLSDMWEGGMEIHKSYIQLIQRIDREIPDMYLRKPKHILIYADFYHIQPCMDVEKFKRRVAEAIRLSSQKKKLVDVITEKFSNGYLSFIMNKYGREKENLLYPLKTMLLYFDQDDRLIEEKYKTQTLLNDGGMDVVSYPLYILQQLRQGNINVKEYTYQKFYKLNKLLLSLGENDD